MPENYRGTSHPAMGAIGLAAKRWSKAEIVANDVDKNESARLSAIPELESEQF